MSSPVFVRASWSYVLIAWLFLAFPFFPVVRANAGNITIDDQNGDASTGVMPVYSPAGQWSFGPTCTDCRIKPDASDALDNSWHDTTAVGQPASVTLSFNGTAVYVFCIVADTIVGVDTTMNLAFSLDGSSAGAYKHVPSTATDIQYNVMVFAKDGLEDGPHTLVVGLQAPSVMLFDYALYTPGEPQPQPPPPPPSSTSLVTSTLTSSSEVVVTLPPSTSTTTSTIVIPPVTSPTPSAQLFTTPESSSQSSNTFSDTSSIFSQSGSSAVSHILTDPFPTGGALLSTASAATTDVSTAADTTNGPSSVPTASSGPHIPTIAIIGAGAGALVLAVLVALFCMFRRRKSRYQDLDKHTLEQHAVEEFVPCYMPPASLVGRSSVSGIHSFSSSASLLERSSAPVPPYTQGQNASTPSVASEPNQSSIQVLQQPLRVFNRATDRVALPSAGDAEVDTLASGVASVTTMEETAMRARVDVLHNQVERLVSPQEPTWEDLPPAYDGPSNRRILPPRPGFMPSNEKNRF